MADNVKVAVRVRPFNSRENTRNSTLIIEMIGKSTEIKDPENPKAEPRKFAFDYSYWSHDDFTERADGYLEPKSPKYADQQIVFNDLGLGVLDNAWKGYNTSLFAYGQTGSGKSYSMVGYGVNKGIVPLACEELFNAIEKKRVDAKEGEEYQVTFSMLEIYNEQVRDLLNPASLKVKGGLKVRQHSNKGFYVEQLMTVPVNSYTEIDSKINEGTKNRTVASTNMNATSSRAHTIVAINFTQKSPNAAGQSMTKTSVINLVDLAGSERADATGATGDRLKEGAGINQSLSTLGNCIKALADMSQGKKSIIVPFRDSVLTKLLKNALGGNSKTIMIAALSPADINYDETLSTLRFADRAKAIKTQAVVNESPTEKLIRELREENARLMDMLKSGGTMPAAPASGGGGGGGDATAVEEMRKQMEDELRRNQEEMEAMQETWQQKMAEREKEFQAEIEATQLKKEQQKTIPHFWNLNEDPSLTAMIIHFTPKGKTRLGSSKANPPPDIMLAGLSIQPEHALVEYDGKKKVTLLPLPGAKVVLNGNEIKEKKELHHNDRVLFGSTNLFVFHHPQDYAKQQKDNKTVPAPSYDSAQEEIAKSSGLSKFTSGGKSKDDLILQEDLIEMFPMVSEANAISEELDKKCKFELALISPQARGKKDGRTEVCVKMRNLGNDTEFMWDRSKFINRKFLMQEMYQDYVNGDDDWDLPKEKDPFWEDPATEVHLGSVHVYLQSLAYMMELEESLQVTDYRGIEQGRLQVEIVPCNKDGQELDDEYVDDPEELVGKDLYFKVKVQNARGLPSRYSSTSCKYKLYLDDDATTTREVAGMNPEYGHEKQYTFHPVTKQFVDYLQNEALLIEVWGRQKDGTGSGAPLTTRELVTREMSMVDLKTKETPKANGKSSVQPGMTAGEKRRMEKAEEKLNNLQTLLNAAKQSSSAVVQVKDVERILAGGASKFTQDNSNKAKDDKMGTNASQACLIQ